MLSLEFPGWHTAKLVWSRITTGDRLVVVRGIYQGDIPATCEPRAGVFQLTIYSYQIACNEPDYMVHYILSTELKTNTVLT